MSGFSSINIHGKDYDVIDKKSRRLISDILKNTKNDESNMIILRQGLIDLAGSVKTMRTEMANKLSLNVDEVSSFPILRFTSDFSILIDITICIDNEMYSSQQIVKCYHGKLYRNVIDNNCTVDCYCQVGLENNGVIDGNVYLFFDVHFEQYNLNLNIISYDGNLPKFVIDEEKFSQKRYPNSQKLK